jgi:alpha-mannosidase
MMYYSSGKWKNFNYKRLKRQVSELFPLSIISRKKLNKWIFEVDGKNDEVEVGYKWDFISFPVTFKTETVFNTAGKNQIVSLEAWTGGESLVKIDSVPYGEINEYHKFLDITKFCNGKSHFIEIESVPKGLLGTTNYTPIFKKAFITIFDEEILKSYLIFKNAADLIESVDDDLKNKVYFLFMKGLGMMNIPSSTKEYELRSLDDETLTELTKIWKAPNFSLNEGVQLSSDVRKGIIEAADFLRKSIEKMGNSSSFTVYAMGHSHIDYAWLWPVEETKRKIARTFSNALRMLEKFKDFRFVQSSSTYYEDIKDIYPTLFETIASYVKEGRWEIIGGSVVEFDANFPSGESLARQFLYGQKFFEKEFNKRCKIAYLPDTFGFTWTLPQILKESGIDYFVTTKLAWNDKNPFPYSWFKWRGLDGTEVVAHIFNTTSGYNALFIPQELKNSFEFHKEKHSNVPFSILTFGYGDGGGGPTDEMMYRYKMMRNLPSLPKLEIKNFEAVFEKYKFRDLPVVDDELYLEFHRGTYTSQAAMKKLNREMENLLYVAEVLATLNYLKGEEYPHDVLTSSRKNLAKAQFHDVLPGSSIREVYEEFLPMLQTEKEKIFKLIHDLTLKYTSKVDREFSVLNLTNFTLPFIIREASNMEEGAYDKCFVQKGKDGKSYVIGDHLKALYVHSYEKRRQKETKSMKISSNFVENEFVKLEVNEKGCNVYDKHHKRYLFKGNGFKLIARRDIPAEFEAWDVPYDSEKEVELIPYKIEVYDKGSAMSSLLFRYEFEGSNIEMIARIYKGHDVVDLKFNIDWHTRRYMLKLYMPFDLLTREANFEIAYGIISRKTTRNNSYEMARFEVPYHRWINLSEDDYGVSVVNNGKYGCSVEGATLSLSLIRGSIIPDFYSDEGKHEFTFCLFPTDKEWKEKTLKHALLLNMPLITVKGKTEDFLKTLRELFDENESLVLSAVKKEEDGERVVIRFYEPYGKRDILKLTHFGNLSNILEDDLEKKVKKLEFNPFEVKTLLFDKNDLK